MRSCKANVELIPYTRDADASNLKVKHTNQQLIYFLNSYNSILTIFQN